MRRLSGLTLFSAFLLCSFGTATAAAPFRIIIERTESGSGTLTLWQGTEEILSTDCREDTANWIAPRKYTRCSATKTSRGQKPAIYLPNEQTGRDGIFVRATTNAGPDGAIFVDENDMNRIYASIKPKNARNVTVLVRSVKVSRAMRATRAMIAKAKEELETANQNNDVEAAREAEKLLVFSENLYRLQELAETQAVSEEMVTKDAFLSELVEKGTDALKKTALKTALKQVLKRIGTKGLGGPAGVIIDLGAADDIARDPNEVFRDENASDSEVTRAIASTLATKRNERNSAQLDRSLLLILRELGCEVEIR